VAGHVFVAYNKDDPDDYAYVTQLEYWLRQRGAETWIDLMMLSGPEWDAVIREQIHSCAVMVVVMSPQAAESETVQQQALEARRIKKPILPLLLRGEAWTELKDYQVEVVRDGSMPSQRFIGSLASFTSLSVPPTSPPSPSDAEPPPATRRTPSASPPSSVPPAAEQALSVRRVFISYRRDDSIAIAGRIRDRVAGQFGVDNVFFDIDTIPLGVDFRTHIDSKIAECDIVLVIIGRRWLTASNDRGVRRLDLSGDFVRLEVEAALRRDIPVVPLLVEGATMPDAADLPDSIANLAFRNGTQVRYDPDFHPDMEKLFRRLTGT
jgi:hypothetical protein